MNRCERLAHFSLSHNHNLQATTSTAAYTYSRYTAFGNETTSRQKLVATLEFHEAIGHQSFCSRMLCNLLCASVHYAQLFVGKHTFLYYRYILCSSSPHAESLCGTGRVGDV